jgi:hypothetical protein
MPIEISHKFICDICRKTFEPRNFQYHENEIPLIPHLPQDWQKVGGLTVCPEHKIKTTIDGKEM